MRVKGSTKVLVTLVFVSLEVAHRVFPSVKLDAIDWALLVAATLPWILKYLRGFEIPGIVKIDLAETKAATDKVTRAELSSGHINFEGHPPRVSIGVGTRQLSNLRPIYDTDPNLALVGFRIEVEKRLRDLAAARQISDDKMPLQRLLREMIDRRFIPPEIASGIMELIALGNRAAHGVTVSPDAAAWLLDVGPDVLLRLDSLLQTPSAGGAPP
jgi:hypothetical protein